MVLIQSDGYSDILVVHAPLNVKSFGLCWFFYSYKQWGVLWLYSSWQIHVSCHTNGVHFSPESGSEDIMFSICPSVRSSGQILLPRYITNGLSNFDETNREYSSATADDLIRFWRSKVKVTAGRRGGEGKASIHVDVGASNSVSKKWWCTVFVNISVAVRTVYANVQDSCKAIFSVEYPTLKIKWRSKCQCGHTENSTTIDKVTSQ